MLQVRGHCIKQTEANVTDKKQAIGCKSSTDTLHFAFKSVLHIQFDPKRHLAQCFFLAQLLCDKIVQECFDAKTI